MVNCIVDFKNKNKNTQILPQASCHLDTLVVGRTDAPHSNGTTRGRVGSVGEAGGGDQARRPYRVSRYAAYPGAQPPRRRRFSGLPPTEAQAQGLKRPTREPGHPLENRFSG